jgi:hypothetical protein
MHTRHPWTSFLPPSFVHFRVPVSVTRVFLHGRVASPTHNPQPGGPVVSLCLTPSPKPVWHGWTCQKHKTAVNIAFGITRVHKLLHLGKEWTHRSCCWTNLFLIVEVWLGLFGEKCCFQDRHTLVSKKCKSLREIVEQNRWLCTLCVT